MSSEATLLWGVVFGSVGVGYFMYGKKQRVAAPMLCGIALIVFPYFVSNTIVMVLVGLLLTAVPWFIRL